MFGLSQCALRQSSSTKQNAPSAFGSTQVPATVSQVEPATQRLVQGIPLDGTTTQVPFPGDVSGRSQKPVWHSASASHAPPGATSGTMYASQLAIPLGSLLAAVHGAVPMFAKQAAAARPS
jgi:hypothetical protein